MVLFNQPLRLLEIYLKLNGKLSSANMHQVCINMPSEMFVKLRNQSDKSVLLHAYHLWNPFKQEAAFFL